MWTVGVILTFFDDLETFFPLLAFAGNVLYRTQLNSASSSWSCLICCFCSPIIPTYCVSTLTFCIGGAMSQFADTADADADEDVNVVLESICFSCPPTIVDEQCKVNVIVYVLIRKKKSCIAYLWLTQSFWINVQMACLNLKWNHVFFQQQLLKNRAIWYAYFKHFQMLEIQILSPLLLRTDFPGYRGLQYVHIFLSFESFQISSNVRNPITPGIACLWIPMLTLHIHSQHLRLY